MKKFWKLILISIIIIGGIGTYYVQSAMLTSTLPEYKIKTIEGNDQVIDSLIIQGFYHDDNLSDSFTLTNKETVYSSELSFVERITGNHSHTMERLRKEYPGFMRGVSYIHENVYEDDQRLILVESDISYNGHNNYETTLELSYLNKKTGKKHNFSQKFMDTGVRNVADLQFDNNQIVVLIRDYSQKKGVPEIVELVFDPSQSKLVSERTIISPESPENKNYYVTLDQQHQSVSYQSNNFAVFRVKYRHHRNSETSDSTPVDELKDEIYVYHAKTGAVEKVDLPVEKYGLAFLFDGENLYYRDDSEEQVNLRPYNLSKKKFMDEITVETNEDKETFLTVSNDHLYVLNDGHIKVLNVESGEVIYQGEIVAEDGSNLVKARFNHMTLY